METLIIQQRTIEVKKSKCNVRWARHKERFPRKFKKELRKKGFIKKGLGIWPNIIHQIPSEISTNEFIKNWKNSRDETTQNQG